MEEIDLFKSTGPAPPVFILTLDDQFEEYGVNILHQLRKEGIRSDLYPSGDRMRKQMRYANRIRAKYVIILGSEERERKEKRLRKMKSGKQKKLARQEGFRRIKEK